MTFRETINAYQYQCCLNVYYDMDAYTDAELEDIATGHNDPVYREAARAALVTRERMMEMEAV